MYMYVNNAKLCNYIHVHSMCTCTFRISGSEYWGLVNTNDSVLPFKMD